MRCGCNCCHRCFGPMIRPNCCHGHTWSTHHQHMVPVRISSLSVFSSSSFLSLVSFFCAYLFLCHRERMRGDPVILALLFTGLPRELRSLAMTRFFYLVRTLPHCIYYGVADVSTIPHLRISCKAVGTICCTFRCTRICICVFIYVRPP